MTPKPPQPRTYHMARHIRSDGAVSALCFATERECGDVQTMPLDDGVA